MKPIISQSSHRHTRSNPTSNLKNLVQRRFFIPLILIFLFLIYYSPFSRRRSSRLAKAAQEEAYALAPRSRPTCPWTPWHTIRYGSVSNPSRRKGLFLAMNLHQNEEVLPTFFQELPIVIEALGPDNVFVSIYENGSEDKTPQLLGLLGRMLDSMGTRHQIISKGASEKSHKEDGHRIAVLAAARNNAMKPLYDGRAAKQLSIDTFDEVLWLNDIYFCAADVLEVLLQRRTQGAHQACATDWGGRVIYDRWVTRAMSGRTMYKWEELVEWYNGPDPPPGQSKVIPHLLPYESDAPDRIRIQSGLPVQVFSCWNGITVFDAKAFYAPHDMRFRQAKNDYDDNGKQREYTEKSSECFLPSVDLWKAGMGKIVMTPKASVAYTLDDYNFYRQDGPLRASRTLKEEKLDWITSPPKEVMFQDNAAWYIPERWGPWDEP